MTAIVFELSQTIIIIIIIIIIYYAETAQHNHTESKQVACSSQQRKPRDAAVKYCRQSMSYVYYFRAYQRQ